MKTGQATALAPYDSNSRIEDLIEVAFTQIKELGAAQESSNLFPNGVGSLDLEISSGPDHHVSLRISGAQAATIADQNSVFLGMERTPIPEFNAEGHHIVALIAELDLTQSFPQTMKKVQKILDDGGRTFLDAAVFPDQIRQSQPQTKPFHFIDIPFTAGGPTDPPLPPTPHIISKIEDFTGVLRQGGSAQGRVDALSWLIHLFGDIHQPLHCTERISPLHPTGDRGGNSFLLKGRAKNLHSLWDSSVNFSNPNDTQLAHDILAEHTRAKLATDLQVNSVETWARASFKLAKKFAYGPLTENPATPPTPSATYLKNAEKVGRRQAALGAYRLSNRLHEILG